MESYENGAFHLATKRAVWSKGEQINDYFILFGNWTGVTKANKAVNISISQKLELNLHYENGFISEIESSDLKFADLGTNSWSKCVYFLYNNGPFTLGGYFLLSFETWELNFHVTRSNLPDFPIGVVKMEPENKWTYGDLIDDWTEEEILEKESETGGAILISTTVIKDFYGKIMGKIETYSNGNQIGYNFYGRIVGFYYSDTNTTTDYTGKIVSTGNTLAALIVNGN